MLEKLTFDKIFWNYLLIGTSKYLKTNTLYYCRLLILLKSG